MKNLIVYYSLIGCCDKVAATLQKEIDADCIQLHDKSNYNGVSGFFNSFYKSVFRKDTEIEEADADISDYDNVILITPLWMGKLTPAMRKFVEINKDYLKNISIITTGGISGAGGAVKELYKYYNLSVDKKLSLSVNDVENDNYEPQLSTFYTLKTEKNVRPDKTPLKRKVKDILFENEPAPSVDDFKDIKKETKTEAAVRKSVKKSAPIAKNVNVSTPDPLSENQDTASLSKDGTASDSTADAVKSGTVISDNPKETMPDA